jgi:GcrA cell cycle regulator
MKNNAKKIKTIENIELHDCRWPFGDPRDAGFHFCGAPQVAGKPYCIEHWPLSFVSARARQQQLNAPRPVLALVPPRKAA